MTYQDTRCFGNHSLDGGILVRRRKHGRGSPLALIFKAFVICIGFKLLVFYGYGSAEYNSRIATLSNGTSAEQAIAVVMKVDPIMKAVIGQTGTVRW